MATGRKKPGEKAKPAKKGVARKRRVVKGAPASGLTGHAVGTSSATGNIRGGVSSSMGNFTSIGTGYVTPAPDSYVVPNALRQRVDDVRAEIIPRLNQIEAILKRIEPVLISDSYKRWIGGNQPPDEINEEHLTHSQVAITRSADKVTRIQLSPIRPSIDRDALALAWRAFKSVAKAAASLTATMVPGLAVAWPVVGELMKDPAQFHQDILNLQSNLDSVATGLWHLLRGLGLPL